MSIGLNDTRFERGGFNNSTRECCSSKVQLADSQAREDDLKVKLQGAEQELTQLKKSTATEAEKLRAEKEDLVQRLLTIEEGQ